MAFRLKNGGVTYLFLKHAGEMCIISLIEEKRGISAPEQKDNT
jgi:hypothetical protein